MGNIPSVATGQKATAAQYNALQAGLNPLVESSYTSWKLKSGFPITLPATPSFYCSPIIDEINDILYLDSGDYSLQLFVVNIGTASVISYITSTVTYYPNQKGNPQPRAGSLSRQYYLYIDSSDVIHVLSKGVEISTVSLPVPPFSTTPGDTPAPVLSQTGKYIVAFPSVTADLYVYEGQS